MGLIDRAYVESRYIQGVPLLGADAWAPSPGWVREQELYTTFGPAMDAARQAPDTWVICEQQYTVWEHAKRFLGIRFKPTYLRLAVALDTVSGKLVFVLASDVATSR